MFLFLPRIQSLEKGEDPRGNGIKMRVSQGRDGLRSEAFRVKSLLAPSRSEIKFLFVCFLFGVVIHTVNVGWLVSFVVFREIQSSSTGKK